MALLDSITGDNISIVLFFIGLYGLMSQKSMVKSIISMTIMNTSVFLFFVNISAESGFLPPIGSENTEAFTDPVPQALMITAIVIGIATTAGSLIMFLNHKKSYGSTHWQKIKRDE